MKYGITQGSALELLFLDIFNNACGTTECFTRGGTRHFVNNSDTNKDIATKFGVDLPQFMRSLVTL
jgi:hypothetical protein